MISAAQRTRETWERVAAELSIPPAPAYEDGSITPAAAPILGSSRQIDGSARTLLVIGHNPGLHDLARNLIASGDVEWRERLNEGLPTAGLVVIDFAVENWRKVASACRPSRALRHPRSLAAADRV